MLWEQAAACNYFPTDKRLMGVYCLYWIFCASLSKRQASHPWLILEFSMCFPNTPWVRQPADQAGGTQDWGFSTTKHHLWGSQG